MSGEYGEEVRWWTPCPSHEREDVEWLYGTFLGGDPRMFKPDGEVSFPDEITRWAADCTRWEILDRRGVLSMPEAPSSGFVGPVHVQLSKYGPGTSFFFVPPGDGCGEAEYQGAEFEGLEVAEG